MVVIFKQVNTLNKQWIIMYIVLCRHLKTFFVDGLIACHVNIVSKLTYIYIKDQNLKYKVANYLFSLLKHNNLTTLLYLRKWSADVIVDHSSIVKIRSAEGKCTKHIVLNVLYGSNTCPTIRRGCNHGSHVPPRAKG